MWCARYAWLVIILWVVICGSLFATGQLVGTRTYGITDDVGLEKLDSIRAGSVFDANGGSEASETLYGIINHPDLKVSTPEFKAKIASVVIALRSATYLQDGIPAAIFSQVVDPTNTLPLLGLNSVDGSASRIQATIQGERELVKKKISAVRPLLNELTKQGSEFKVFFFSSTIINNEALELAAHELDGSLKITIPATFIILLIAFGTLAAALIPLFLAISSLMAAFGILAIYSNTTNGVDSNTTQLIVLMGLAVGIDYSLFMITRYRVERRRGRDKLAAIEIASGTSGRAVFFSGMVVIISLAGLFIIGIPTFISMAIATIGVVLVSVIGSFTLIPAVLAVLGNGVNWGRIPYFGREHDEGSGFWSKLVHRVMQHPIIMVSVVTVLLLALALPLSQFKLGNNGIDGLPDSLDSVQAIHLLTDKWPQGTILRMNVVITNADNPETKQAIDNFTEAALKTNGLSGPVDKSLSRNGKVLRLSIIMSGKRNDQSNKDLIMAIRNELIPRYFGSLPGVTALVSGATALTIDTTKLYMDALPLIFVFVLGLSFILLLVAFHSLIIPIKAIILNLLSTGASYGVLVLVFQEGWFSDQLGFRPTGVIESFVPLFLFTILFGLSMDYHLFILTRIKEAKDRGMPSDEAVEKGISITSGVITSAAAIMVVVFAVFVTLRIIIIKQLGLGLAVAVFVDATIIRSILLPAAMQLLGEMNWYIPRFLDWIPQVTIEGEPETAEKSAELENTFIK
jgi:RND superfamily putative drug exporter